MIGKLIRHDARRNLPLIGIILGASTLLTLAGIALSLTGHEVMSQLGLVTSAISCSVLLAGVQLALGIDYWRSAHSRLGYFAQTLPVRGRVIFWAKFLWAGLVTIVATLWTLVLFLLMLMANADSFETTPGQILSELSAGLSYLMGALSGWAWVALPVAALVLLMSAVVQYFFAASIGSQRLFNSMGWGGPVVVWFILYVALQLIMLAALFLIPVALFIGDGTISVEVVQFLQLIRDGDDAAYFPLGMFFAMIVVFVGLIWWTIRSLEHRVALT